MRWDGEQRREAEVNESDLVCPTWEADMLAGAIPASQAVADRLITAGYAGMRVRSFAPGASAGDLNLVLWSWSADRPNRVILIDDEGRLSRPAHGSPQVEELLSIPPRSP